MTDAPHSGDLDAVVLRRLRGLPGELWRFSNVLKQSHAGDRSAAEFCLSRPTAADSFPAAPAPWFGDGRHRLWRRVDIVRYAEER